MDLKYDIFLFLYVKIKEKTVDFINYFFMIEIQEKKSSLKLVQL